jgi:hypothetical protein
VEVEVEVEVRRGLIVVGCGERCGLCELRGFSSSSRMCLVASRS